VLMILTLGIRFFMTPKYRFGRRPGQGEPRNLGRTYSLTSWKPFQTT
jgi:hypothetical protein